jgi:hypothetical protein
MIMSKEHVKIMTHKLYANSYVKIITRKLYSSSIAQLYIYMKYEHDFGRNNISIHAKYSFSQGAKLSLIALALLLYSFNT